MDYEETAGSGEWIGFDADMAKLVAEKLGVEIQFVEIEWDNKVFELNGKTIDVVWNGMTLTDAVMEAMECTNAYCQNAQVVISKYSPVRQPSLNDFPSPRRQRVSALCLWAAIGHHAFEGE